MRQSSVVAFMTGWRLDKALQVLFPELGIRGCRRLCQERDVRVDGRRRAGGYRLTAGERISLDFPEERPGDALDNQDDAPRLLAERNGLYFLYKPVGLHSAALAGSASPSLEALLPQMFPEDTRTPQLLTRLDRGTSGLVAASLPEEAARWRALEDAGRCEKRYLAVLSGCLDRPVSVRRSLDTANRATTKVLDGNGDALRATFLTPLGILDPQEGARLFAVPCGQLTVAGCVIHKGARHQIRAHAASVGHPLEGDRSYGARGDSPFLLHHGVVVLDAAPIMGCVPIWLALLPEAVRTAALSWLQRGMEREDPAFSIVTGAEAFAHVGM